jgi:hypothetical protein
MKPQIAIIPTMMTLLNTLSTKKPLTISGFFVSVVRQLNIILK